MTSFLLENGLKTYKIAMSILLKFLTFGRDISRTIWHIEVSDGSFFRIFQAHSFELNVFFDRSFPFHINIAANCIMEVKGSQLKIKG